MAAQSPALADRLLEKSMPFADCYHGRSKLFAC